MNNYNIIKADYNKYLELNGILNSRCAMAQKIKDNNADYFYIEKDNEIIDDFAIYKDEKWFTLDKKYFENKDLIKVIFDEIKKKYEYIYIYVPVEQYEIINFIKNNYRVESNIEEQFNHKFEHIKFNL